METNSFFFYIISHITITGYKAKTTTALHAFKIYHKLSVVSSLNNASPHPEPALTHLSMFHVIPPDLLVAAVFIFYAKAISKHVLS